MANQDKHQQALRFLYRLAVSKAQDGDFEGAESIAKSVLDWPLISSSLRIRLRLLLAMMVEDKPEEFLEDASFEISMIEIATTNNDYESSLTGDELSELKARADDIRELLKFESELPEESSNDGEVNDGEVNDGEVNDGEDDENDQRPFQGQPSNRDQSQDKQDAARSDNDG